jgi:Na+/serine symporter
MTASSPSLWQHLKRTSLVTQIIIGLIAGIALALFARSGKVHGVYRQGLRQR